MKQLLLTLLCSLLPYVAAEASETGCEEAPAHVIVSSVNVDESTDEVNETTDFLDDATVSPIDESIDDSLSISLDEVLVRANAVSATAPMAVTAIDKPAIKAADNGKDLPWLLGMTPSLVVTSDNGLGIGLSSFRIRGTDASRINLTYDGIALNGPEDQTVFWANMNAFASSTESIQVQRGVGSSTNGSGAFGATVTMQSQKPAMEPSLSASIRGGSYGTQQYTIQGSSGLIDDQWAFDGRYSQTLTDGYIDRTAANLGSYFLSAGYYGDALTIRLKNFGSFEHTGQAWNGVPSDSIAAGNRTYNSLGRHLDDNGNVIFTPTTDNYLQNHTQLTFVTQPTARLSLHGVLHYTFGRGYYDDYKADASYWKFGLDSFDDGFGHIVSKGDLVRQKWLLNHNMGARLDAVLATERLDLSAGIAASHYIGGHWGEVSYVRAYPLHFSGHYYDSDGRKSETSAYAKAEYRLTSRLMAYVDLQGRFVDYRIDGSNDKFLPDHSQQLLDVHEAFPFFNPKAGFSWHTRSHNAYASAARTHREPTRDNYTDAGVYDPKPTFETLNDFELGYAYRHTFSGSHSTTIEAGFNLYHMDYDNQLIQTGRLSDIGEALTTNAARSYRQGIEVTASFRSGLVNASANCAISRSRLTDFTEYVDNWDGEVLTVHYTDTPLALSPALTSAASLRIGSEELWGTLTGRYVGRQYLDNTGCDARSLDPYSVVDLRLGYTFDWQHYYEKSTRFTLMLDVNNLLGARYATGGWVYTAVSESCGYALADRYREDGLFVQAPTTVFLTLAMEIGK